MSSADSGRAAPCSRQAAATRARSLRAEMASSYAGLSSSVLRRAVQAVLVLEELERRRLENQGGETLWRSVVAETDAWIDGEADLG